VRLLSAEIVIKSEGLRRRQFFAHCRQRHGLKGVTITTDPVDDGEAMTLILQKFAKSGLHAGTWTFGTAPAEQPHHAIDLKWRGEMPRSYWFDGKERLRA
jgi:hypothetical protein